MTGNFAASELTMGQLNAGVKIIGGKEQFEGLLRGEVIVVGPGSVWSERKGMTYFLAMTDGTTGPAWIKRLESQNFTVSYDAREYLNSSSFKPTTGIITVGVIIKAPLVPTRRDYLEPEDIRKFATRMKFVTPSTELALLAIEKFPRKYQKRIGLDRIVAMHDPINVGKQYRQAGELLATPDLSPDGDCLTTEMSAHLMYEKNGFIFEAAHF